MKNITLEVLNNTRRKSGRPELLLSKNPNLYAPFCEFCGVDITIGCDHIAEKVIVVTSDLTPTAKESKISPDVNVSGYCASTKSSYMVEVIRYEDTTNAQFFGVFNESIEEIVFRMKGYNSHRGGKYSCIYVTKFTIGSEGFWNKIHINLDLSTK